MEYLGERILTIHEAVNYIKEELCVIITFNNIYFKNMSAKPNYIYTNWKAINKICYLLIKKRVMVHFEVEVRVLPFFFYPPQFRPFWKGNGVKKRDWNGMWRVVEVWIEHRFYIWPRGIRMMMLYKVYMGGGMQALTHSEKHIGWIFLGPV